jgi:hypothetical protein
MSTRSNTPSVDVAHVTSSVIASPTTTYIPTVISYAPKKNRQNVEFSDVDYESGDDTNLFGGKHACRQLVYNESVSSNNGSSASTASFIDSHTTATGSVVSPIVVQSDTDGVHKRNAEFSEDDFVHKKARRDDYVTRLEQRLRFTQNMSAEHEENDKRRGNIIIASNAFIETQRKYIAELQSKIGGLETTIKYREEDIDNEEAHNLHERNAIRESVNALRYVYEFGVNKSRDEIKCPVSLDLLLPNTPVLLLQAACGCNCMIKYTHAESVIKRFGNSEVVRCFTCTTPVDKIFVTTTDNARKMFAWRDVENSCQCYDHQEIHEIREQDIEKNKAEQFVIDTHGFRAQIQDIKDTLAGIAGK